MKTKNETELALFVLILNYSAAASALKTHRRTEEMPLTIFTTAAASAQCLHFFFSILLHKKVPQSDLVITGFWITGSSNHYSFNNS